MARQFTVVLAAVLLVAAIIVLVLMLFRQQPIQIVLETGQEVTTKSPDYFTIGSVMILIVSSFLIGAAGSHLFYNADAMGGAGSRKQYKEETAMSRPLHPQEGKGGDAGEKASVYSVILPLLREDEKKAVRIIHAQGGEMLQNELVLKLGLSKVKTTRILASLERKQIVRKQRHGLTNHIVLLHSG